MLIVLILHITVVITVTAQKNLTPNGTATQSSDNDAVKGQAENAINPPISNQYGIDQCSSTKLALSGNFKAWWLFNFTFDTAYITDVTIYYRENYAYRMDGFQLFVTNASTIPPVDHACYNETQGQPYPNISQTIPCNKIGKYVIYYDGTGSDEGGQIYEPSIELCYVAINGCPSTFWGSNCEISCAESCISQSCFPGNGSCIWGGCHDKNCLRSNCEKPAICTDGCNGNRTGPNCDKHNMAFNSSVMFNQIVIDQDSLVNDGDKKSCVKIQQSTERIVVDINETSIVNEIYLHLNVNTNISGNHTIYASNASDLSEHKTVLYNNESSPPTLITTRAVFRYLIYVFPRQDENSLSEICEIGIFGCPRSSYGLLCNETCPQNCKGPCDLDTGICKFGCVSGWIGSKCETDVDCVVNDTFVVCLPQNIKVNPSSGPVYGGTVVTITGKYIGNVTDNIVVAISGVQCHNITVIKPDTRLTCIIGEGNIPQAKGLFVSVNSNNFSDSNTTYFSFKRPRIVNVNPTKGIVSGGTTVTIGGQNIAFEGRNRYNISFCNNEICIECSNLPTALNEPIIKCKTGQSEEPRNMTRLQVVIDDLTNLTLNETFRYLPDPTFNISNEPQKSVQSGGSTFTIRGEGFNNVENITVEKVDKPCDVPDDTLAVCNTPPNLNNETNNQTIIVHFDGLTVHIPIEYVTDPTFERFQGVQDYDKESTITIKGRNILNGARRDDYSIHVGLDGSCLLIGIYMERIICYPPKAVPRTNQTDVNIVYVIVNVGNIKAYIGDLLYKEDVNTLAFVVGALAAALATAIVIGVSAVVILRKKKKKAIKEFKMELMTREEIIRKASREEFADAQMNIRDIKSDLVTTRVPYSSYQNYILHQLFPNQDISNNPLLHDSEITDDRKAGIKSAIEKFEMLLSNKLFLKSLIQTLDRPNMLTMQEKAHFASVLSISLLGNMRLFFDLVQCLLVDMVRSSTKKQHKVLFRRFDSITMRLMVNWLQIGLYKHLTSRSGIHLFMLYRAVQTIIEMGPIDALTGNSKNTIAEEKLLKMRIEYQSLTLQIDLNGNSDQHYPVKVLDCDTISQVKQKCCAQIYKNKPASEIPHNDELSLEWQQGKAGKLLLNDIDNTSDRNNGLVCLNTLKHYMVQDDSKMALMYKQHDDDDVYVNSTEIRTESVTSEDITLLMPDKCGGEELETHKWHLPNLSDDIKSNRETDFGEIFLNRLFHTKLLLTDYIDSTFEGLIDPQSLSISIRYFLHMLDKFGNDFKIETEVLQAWKNECYGTRVWAPLIGKPNILFDVNVPGHVEPCLDILRQVFVESFTQTAHKVNKESPPQKLLFHKDIPRYRKLIDPFFIRVEAVTDKEFWSEIDEISNTQRSELKFSRQSTIHQLYNLFIGKYKSEIVDDFEDMEESKDLQFANKLEEVIDLMEESAAGS